MMYGTSLLTDSLCMRDQFHWQSLKVSPATAMWVLSNEATLIIPTAGATQSLHQIEELKGESVVVKIRILKHGCEKVGFDGDTKIIRN